MRRLHELTEHSAPNYGYLARLYQEFLRRPAMELGTGLIGRHGFGPAMPNTSDVPTSTRTQGGISIDGRTPRSTPSDVPCDRWCKDKAPNRFSPGYRRCRRRRDRSGTAPVDARTPTGPACVRTSSTGWLLSNPPVRYGPRVRDGDPMPGVSPPGGVPTGVPGVRSTAPRPDPGRARLPRSRRPGRRHTRRGRSTSRGDHQNRVAACQSRPRRWLDTAAHPRP